MKKIFFIIIFLVLCFICYYSVRVEPNKLIVKNETLYLPHWNKGLDGLRIAVISDLHVGSPKVSLIRLQSIVKLVNSQNPDIIFLLGDLDAMAIAESKISQDEISKILSGLKAPYGVISVMGNHDYEPEGIVKNIFCKSKITLLENHSKYIKYKGHTVRIVGFKDLWHHYLEPESIIGSNDSVKPIIVLSHNPDVFPDVPDFVSLTLSGHTHGGEVYLPMLGAPMVPSKFAQRYRKGYVVENNKHLFVSSGVGTLSPFRLFNPPEVVILTLNSQTPKNVLLNTKPHKGFHRNYIPCFNKLLEYLRKYNN